MATLFLARHGETAWGLTRYAGSTDVPLSDRGHEQGRQLAERLRAVPLVAIIASDLQRAVATAEAVAADHGLTVEIVSALREQGHGEWEGLSSEEIRAGWPESVAARDAAPATFAPPGGETLTEVATRALPVLEELLRRARTGNVLVVAHQNVNRVLLAQLLQAPLDAARRMHQSPGCVNLIDVADSRFQVYAINDTAHLT